MRLALPPRILLVLLSVFVLLAFSKADPMTLLSVGIGTAAMLIGLGYAYRPASVAGMLLTALGAASAIEIPTVLDFGNMMTGILGLLIPVSLLAWIALAAEERNTEYPLPNRRALLLTALFSLACLWSVPLAVFVTGLFVPGASMRMTAISEISVLLVATAILGTMVMFRTDRIAERVQGTPEVEA